MDDWQEIVTSARCLSPRARQILGLVLWNWARDREFYVDENELYARLRLRSTTVAERRAVMTTVIAELQMVWPEFRMQVGDNDMGEDERLVTITY